MTLILYHGLISTCSQKARLALAEKRLAYTARQIDFRNGEQVSDWYLALNPGGVVPTLDDGGSIVTDSSVICEYLDEVYPDPPLSPGSAAARGKMRSWMRFLEEVPTAAIRAPSFNAVFAASAHARGRHAFDAMTARMPLRRQFYAKMATGRFDDSVVAESLERLSATITRVDAALKQTLWLCGDAYTIADIVLLPTIVRMEDIGLTSLWSDHPRVDDWLARCKARPSYAAAFPQEAHVKPGRMPG